MNRFIALVTLFSIISCTSSPDRRFADKLPEFKKTPVPKIQGKINQYRIRYNSHNIFMDSFTATVNEKDYEVKKLKRLIYHVDRGLREKLERSYELKNYRDWSLRLTWLPVLMFFNNSKTIYLAGMALGLGGYVYFDNQIKDNNAQMFEDYNRKLERNYFYYKVNF